MLISTARVRAANRVANFRDTRNLTQEEFASRASVQLSRRTVQRFEQAARNPEISYDPKLSTVLKMAAGLRTDVATLIGQLPRQQQTV